VGICNFKFEICDQPKRGAGFSIEVIQACQVTMVRCADEEIVDFEEELAGVKN
jgi:hypothetical protein